MLMKTRALGHGALMAVRTINPQFNAHTGIACSGSITNAPKNMQRHSMTKLLRAVHVTHIYQNNTLPSPRTMGVFRAKDCSNTMIVMVRYMWYKSCAL